jgi:succinate dehydrogenase/fumarate reductase cytochrome b subunit
LRTLWKKFTNRTELFLKRLGTAVAFIMIVVSLVYGVYYFLVDFDFLRVISACAVVYTCIHVCQSY